MSSTTGNTSNIGPTVGSGIIEWTRFAVSSTFPKVKQVEKTAMKSNNLKRLIVALHASGTTWRCPNPKGVNHKDANKQGFKQEGTDTTPRFQCRHVDCGHSFNLEAMGTLIGEFIAAGKLVLTDPEAATASALYNLATGVITVKGVMDEFGGFEQIPTRKTSAVATKANAIPIGNKSNSNPSSGVGNGGARTSAHQLGMTDFSIAPRTKANKDTGKGNISDANHPEREAPSTCNGGKAIGDSGNEEGETVEVETNNGDGTKNGSTPDSSIHFTSEHAKMLEEIHSILTKTPIHPTQTATNSTSSNMTWARMVSAPVQRQSSIGDTINQALGNIKSTTTDRALHPAERQEGMSLILIASVPRASYKDFKEFLMGTLGLHGKSRIVDLEIVNPATLGNLVMLSGWVSNVGREKVLVRLGEWYEGNGTWQPLPVEQQLDLTDADSDAALKTCRDFGGAAAINLVKKIQANWKAKMTIGGFKNQSVKATVSRILETSKAITESAPKELVAKSGIVLIEKSGNVFTKQSSTAEKNASAVSAGKCAVSSNGTTCVEKAGNTTNKANMNGQNPGESNHIGSGNKESNKDTVRKEGVKDLGGNQQITTAQTAKRHDLVIGGDPGESRKTERRNNEGGEGPASDHTTEMEIPVNKANVNNYSKTDEQSNSNESVTSDPMSGLSVDSPGNEAISTSRDHSTKQTARSPNIREEMEAVRRRMAELRELAGQPSPLSSTRGEPTAKNPITQKLQEIADESMSITDIQAEITPRQAPRLPARPPFRASPTNSNKDSNDL
jgi:hypothetical protein